MIFLFLLIFIKSEDDIICLLLSNGSCPIFIDKIAYNSSHFYQLLNSSLTNLYIYLITDQYHNINININDLQKKEIHFKGMIDNSFITITNFGLVEFISFENVIINVSNQIDNIRTFDFIIKSSIFLINSKIHLETTNLTIPLDQLCLFNDVEVSNNLILTKYFKIPTTSINISSFNSLKIEFQNIYHPVNLYFSLNTIILTFIINNVSISINTQTESTSTNYLESTHFNDLNIIIDTDSQPYLQSNLEINILNGTINFTCPYISKIPYSSIHMFQNSNMNILSDNGPTSLYIYYNSNINTLQQITTFKHIFLYSDCIINLTSNNKSDIIVRKFEVRPNSNIFSNDINLKIHQIYANSKDLNEGNVIFNHNLPITLLSKFMNNHLTFYFNNLILSDEFIGFQADFDYLESKIPLKPLIAKNISSKNPIKLIPSYSKMETLDLIEDIMYNKNITDFQLVCSDNINKFTIDYIPGFETKGFQEETSIFEIFSTLNKCNGLKLNDLPGNFDQYICIDPNISKCSLFNLRKYDLNTINSWNSTFSKNTKKVTLSIGDSIPNFQFDFNFLENPIEIEFFSSKRNYSPLISITNNIKLTNFIPILSFENLNITFSSYPISFSNQHLIILKKVFFNNFNQIDFSNIYKLQVLFNNTLIPIEQSQYPIIQCDKSFDEIKFIENGWEFYLENNYLLTYYPKNKLKNYVFYLTGFTFFSEDEIIKISKQDNISNLIPFSLLGPNNIEIIGNYSLINYPSIIYIGSNSLKITSNDSIIPVLFNSSLYLNSISLNIPNPKILFDYIILKDNYFPIFQLESNQILFFRNLIIKKNSGIGTNQLIDLNNLEILNNINFQLQNVKQIQNIVLNDNSKLNLYNNFINNSNILFNLNSNLPQIKSNSILNPNIINISIKNDFKFLNIYFPLLCGSQLIFNNTINSNLPFKLNQNSTCMEILFENNNNNNLIFMKYSLIIGITLILFIIIFFIIKKIDKKEESEILSTSLI